VPHRDAVKREGRPARGARRQNRGNGTAPKSSTLDVSEGPEGYTPEGRKSTRDERRAVLLEGMGVPAPWKRLGDVLSEVPA
jgi:hypothetical protein